jgi:hypothetical protein
MRKPPEEMSLSQRLAQSFIISGIMKGLSGNQILKALREQGLGYRTSEFYRDYQYWRQAYEKSIRMRYTRRDSVISEDRYIETYSRVRGGYQTVFRVDVFDRSTLERKSFYVTVIHEHYENGVLVPDRGQIYTRAELEEKALQAFQYRVTAGQYEVENIVPVMGWKVMRNFRE